MYKLWYDVGITPLSPTPVTGVGRSIYELFQTSPHIAIWQLAIEVSTFSTYLVYLQDTCRVEITANS